MTDYTNLQSRCQRGESSLAGANNLLAECHAALGQLMADNDSQRKDLQNLRSDNAQLVYALQQQEQSYLVLRAERDQLKAENEALRKDAERYRWLRGGGQPQPDTMDFECLAAGYSVSAHDGYDTWMERVEGEALDIAIDATMGKGEQS